MMTPPQAILLNRRLLASRLLQLAPSPIMGRCDYCRSPCGYNGQPAVLLPSTSVLCLSCYQERLDEGEEHDAAGWVSSEEEPEFSDEAEPRWGSDEEDQDEP